jgi:hypothetical protein
MGWREVKEEEIKRRNKRKEKKGKGKEIGKMKYLFFGNYD